MEDKLSISVNIAERRFPLRIERSEEEKIRMATKLINEKVLQYKQRFGKDDFDSLAMTSLQYVVEMLLLKDQQDLSPFVEKIEDLNDQLESFFDEKENKE
ncbi:cell division protein ZapA [Halosquirtibacter xylanolyticus]|uniref:cell division protein ZapA n=1 Tax=Halosquirtibacter xylanolyticus TaxID=3374599 RepID=UPI0037499F43|nr:cell division protein ZapA [Prolixibacteraceae bacterium]